MSASGLESNVVLIARAGHVARLTINRPAQLNALGTATVAALNHAFDDLETGD